MCRVGGLHSFQHRIVWRSEKEEELERETMTRVGLFMHRQMMRVLVAVA